MADIIRLLPDHIANQIAAGEVIQRPASVVKELMENAVDAGAGFIKIILKDSGKTLIQVIDDGCGMTETDARLCFERHATSKIRNTEDLFNIRTKGFRGEALASIAAIAHVEMITRASNSDLATRIVIHGSKINKQEYVQGEFGTNFAVKNLFYNVPARRKFLKSDPVELRHLIEEIHRVALAHPEVQFKVYHNGNEVYHLTAGNLKQRIVGIFGKSYNEKLVPIGEQADSINIDGFILKAEVAKRNAGEQYLFVNNRFIKSNYLNHAIKTGFEQLIQADQFPGYFIFLDLDPSTIDINVHPTKTEVKFDEEKLIYNYLRVCVKHALGKYLVAPTLDFDTDTNYLHKAGSPMSERGSYHSSSSQLEKENLSHWGEIYKNLSGAGTPDKPADRQLTMESGMGAPSHGEGFLHYSGKDPYQLHNSFILCHVKNGFILIDQQYAHERIMYEENLKSLQGNRRPVQRELFAQTIEFDAVTATLLQSLLPKLNDLGFEVGEFGKNTFVVHGLPAGLEPGSNAIELLKQLVVSYNENLEFQLGVDVNMARSLASSACLKRGKPLSVTEMKELVDQLFACETPFTNPSGHKTFIHYDLEDIKKQFK
ncbi:MAG: DNA mismatch repair endonuclease MutL [Saprospiraceae bacterium]|nr:DNA mismatch repair endonuclease MutL [Saprospiraceae bacterium]